MIQEVICPRLAYSLSSFVAQVVHVWISFLWQQDVTSNNLEVVRMPLLSKFSVSFRYFSLICVATHAKNLVVITFRSLEAKKNSILADWNYVGHFPSVYTMISNLTRYHWQALVAQVTNLLLTFLRRRKTLFGTLKVFVDFKSSSVVCHSLENGSKKVDKTPGPSVVIKSGIAS